MLATQPPSLSFVTVPNSLCYELLLTATTAISHHDPAVQDESNRTLFNRQKQLLPRTLAPMLPSQTQIDAITSENLLPIDLLELFEEITFPEFVAIALCRQFLDIYNAGDGRGLFSGMERYQMFEPRLRQAAVASPNLRCWWDHLADSLCLPVHDSAADLALLRLLTLPSGVQQSVLTILADNVRSVIALGRLWHQQQKLADPEYAAAVGKPPVETLVEREYDLPDISYASAPIQPVEVPAISGNSLRHQVVRAPAMWHMLAHLGLAEAFPGQGPLPAGLEALFENGGNIEKGAKQPDSAFSLAWRIRHLYPSLDLLGGVTDSFDLHESRLSVSGWLVCRENARAFASSPAADLPTASVSVFDLLDDVTLTRQASRSGSGQMIWSFEALCPGTQVLVRLKLKPWTPILTRGALVAAVNTYLETDGTLCGQAARGYGNVVGELITSPDLDGVSDQECLSAYESYLAANRDQLVAGLIDGTLGTGKRVLT